MTRNEFLDWCHATGLLLDLADPHALGRNRQCELDEVGVGVFFEPHIAPDLLQCYVDIGPISDANRARVHAELLRLNLFTGTKRVGVFAIDPDTGNAVLVVHLQLGAALTSERFAQLLRSQVALARRMRESVLSPRSLPDADELAALACGLA